MIAIISAMHDKTEADIDEDLKAQLIEFGV
jgi:hypothetical protein